MQTILIFAGVLVGIVGIGLTLLAAWLAKQNLVGAWIANLPDGTHVTMEFEGAQKGGTYKQLVKRDGTVVREFGHWTITWSGLRLIMMASDTKAHPRFGVDTLYYAIWKGKSQVTIDGPDRSKWIFQRATDAAKIDFGPGAAMADTWDVNTRRSLH